MLEELLATADTEGGKSEWEASKGLLESTARQLKGLLEQTVTFRQDMERRKDAEIRSLKKHIECLSEFDKLLLRSMTLMEEGGPVSRNT